MFRQLNFRSFFNFLGRNKLYAAINIFGLSVSLMFVILIADYTLRQLTCDDYHAKADRIYVIGNEECITSGYYLQKYLRDRYPEIESTCAVAFFEQVALGLQRGFVIVIAEQRIARFDFVNSLHHGLPDLRHSSVAKAKLGGGENQAAFFSSALAGAVFHGGVSLLHTGLDRAMSMSRAKMAKPS